MPDASMLLKLSQALEIDVNELLAGEEFSTEEYLKRSESNLVNLVGELNEMDKKRKSSRVGTIIGCIFEHGKFLASKIHRHFRSADAALSVRDQMPALIDLRLDPPLFQRMENMRFQKGIAGKGHPDGGAGCKICGCPDTYDRWDHVIHRNLLDAELYGTVGRHDCSCPCADYFDIRLCGSRRNRLCDPAVSDEAYAAEKIITPVWLEAL